MYVATGDRFLNECRKSASSVRKNMPDCPIVLCTNRPDFSAVELFDQVIPIEDADFSFLDKVKYIPRSPFDRTLYLDTDTILVEPVWELAEMLDRFQLAYAHAPHRVYDYDAEPCPEAFCEPNTGVILYQQCAEVKRCFEQWARLYPKYVADGASTDQQSFRAAVYECDVDICILPPEYNLRTPFPWFAGGGMKVKILHGREPSLSKVAAAANKKLGPRIGYYNPAPWSVRVYYKIKDMLGVG